MKQNSSLPALMVFISAVLWGTYGSFVTVITGMGMSRDALVFLRLLATAVPVLVITAVRNPAELKIKNGSDILLFLANGILSVWFFTACYTAAIRETKIAVAAALLYTAPAIVMVLSAVLFHEKLTFRKCLCVLAAIAGCALVSGLAGGAELTPRGLLLGLGAGLGYALYSIFSRYILNRGYSVFANVFYTFMIADCCFLAAGIRNGSAADIVRMPGASALSLLCGLVTGAAAYVLYTSGLKGMESSRAAQIATIEPVTGAVLGMLLFHQMLSGSELLGVALVVGAVVAMNF